MAKAPVKTTVATEKRVFSFDAPKTLDTLPAEASATASRSTELPFKGVMFPAMFPIAALGKIAEEFVPLAYFTEERGAKIAEAVGPSAYMKDKVRAGWKAFQALDEAGRKNYVLHMVFRDGKQEGHPEPGLSVFLQKVA